MNKKEENTSTNFSTILKGIRDALGRYFPTDTRIEQRQVMGNNDVFKSTGIMESLPPSKRKQEDNFRGVFFRCISIRSNLMSKGMMGFSVRRITGQNDSKEVHGFHPWVQLLHNPARDILPAKSVYKWASENYDLIGHADFVVERNWLGVPVRLIPVFQRFGNMYPIPASNGSVAGWVFYRSDGKKQTYAAEDVIRVGRLSPYSPYETISLLGMAILDLDTESYMKSFRTNQVEEKGLPTNILVSDQNISREQALEYSARVREFAIKDKVMVLGNGLKPYSQTAKELEFAKGLLQTKEDIKEITGIPSGLFDAESNRANSDSMRYQLIEDTINPELKDIASGLTFGMERAFNSNGLFIGVPDLRPMDPEEERKQQRHLLETGQKNVNDLRRKKGLKEVPHGNTYWIDPRLKPVKKALQDPFR